MANSSIGLLGRKLGMTQIFLDDGTCVATTVVEVGPNRVLQVKSEDTKDGYNALQLGYGTQKAHRISSSEAGHFAKTESTPARLVREIRVSAEDAKKYAPGQDLSVADLFAEGDVVDARGTSKGRGFAGVMKRHNFRGFIRTHGTHEFFRHGGSIGTRLTPGHTLKGKKMPGRMGGVPVTMQNLDVVRVDAERNLLFLKGGVPGPKGGFITVRKAVKKG